MLDTLSCLQPIYRQSSFIRLKDYDLVHSSLQDCSCMQESGFLKSIKFVWEAVVYVLVLIKNIVVTALYAVGIYDLSSQSSISLIFTNRSASGIHLKNPRRYLQCSQCSCQIRYRFFPNILLSSEVW